MSDGEALDAIEDLVWQGCATKLEHPLVTFDDQGVSAYADALTLLARERPSRWRRTLFGAVLDRSVPR